MSPLPNDLQNLRILLTHLPEELPDVGEDSQYPFVNFQIDPAILKRTNGDIAQALCQTLWATFMDDGLICIDERGAGICGVVDVLADYLNWYPDNADLKNWVSKLRNAATQLHQMWRWKMTTHSAQLMRLMLSLLTQMSILT